MPYSTIADLPPAVRDAYSAACQKVFLEAFNRAVSDSGPFGALSEEKASKVAHSAAGMCKDAGKSAAVKFVDGSDSLIEGLAIPFGGPFAGKDFDGEDFGADTDFAFDLYPHGRPLLYQHGVDASVKLVPQGRQIEHRLDEEGVWAQAQLDLSAKYHATVAKLVAAGKLFFSSGSVLHLIETEPSGHIKRWPWVELSLTPTPANPWATVYPVKMLDLLDHTTAAKLEVSPALVAEALKALDAIKADDDSGSESFDEQGSRVVTELGEYIGRARKRYDIRSAKVGRELSATNRQWLESLDQRLAALAELRDEIKQALARTNPEADQKAIAQLVAAADEQDARLQDALRH